MTRIKVLAEPLLPIPVVRNPLLHCAFTPCINSTRNEISPGGGGGIYRFAYPRFIGRACDYPWRHSGVLIKDLCFAHLHPCKKIILQGREFVRLGFVDVSMIGMADISSTGISWGSGCDCTNSDRISFCRIQRFLSQQMLVDIQFSPLRVCQ